jgi:hypothetical protein
VKDIDHIVHEDPTPLDDRQARAESFLRKAFIALLIGAIAQMICITALMVWLVTHPT